jgi:hypothetical protein
MSCRCRWEGEYYSWPNVLGLYPSTVEGSIAAIADYPAYANTSLAFADGSPALNVVYYGGPTRGLAHTPLAGPGLVLAAYSQKGLPAPDMPAIVRTVPTRHDHRHIHHSS